MSKVASIVPGEILDALDAGTLPNNEGVRGVILILQMTARDGNHVQTTSSGLDQIDRCRGANIECRIDIVSAAEAGKRYARLGKLRRYFDDQLLVWAGGHMVPTPRALALETEIRQVLATMERLSSSPIRSFDPVSSETTMRLVATGYLENLFLTKVMCEVAARAPKMQIEVRPPDRLRDVGALENGGLDFLVGWNMKPAPSLRSRVLFVAVSAACAGIVTRIRSVVATPRNVVVHAASVAAGHCFVASPLKIRSVDADLIAPWAASALRRIVMRG
jgi:hypothetical protein